jgi:hypothetical protein
MKSQINPNFTARDPRRSTIPASAGPIGAKEPTAAPFGPSERGGGAVGVDVGRGDLVGMDSRATSEKPMMPGSRGLTLNSSTCSVSGTSTNARYDEPSIFSESRAAGIIVANLRSTPEDEHLTIRHPGQGPSSCMTQVRTREIQSWDERSRTERRRSSTTSDVVPASLGFHAALISLR